jgi:hypothetical protein
MVLRRILSKDAFDRLVLEGLEATVDVVESELLLDGRVPEEGSWTGLKPARSGCGKLGDGEPLCYLLHGRSAGL